MNPTPYQLLRNKYPEAECVLIKEVPDSASRRRYLDYMVINLWESRGQSVIGFEQKSYRGDWIKEIKSPQKQELHVPYCDYFYLLTTNEKVATLDEIPDNWGWMHIKDGKLVTMKKAPKLSPKPMPKSMIISLLRRAADKSDFVHRDFVEDRINGKLAERLERDVENAVRRVKRKADLYDELVRYAFLFKSKTGVDISAENHFITENKIDDMANKFNFLMQNDFQQIVNMFNFIKAKAENITKITQSGLDLFDKTEQNG